MLDCVSEEAGLPLIIWKLVLLIYDHPVKTYLYYFGKNTVLNIKVLWWFNADYFVLFCQ
jgi:hypothetical protein